jgi:outer membrane protein OmpA-like peptidoglycan-associated protein
MSDSILSFANSSSFRNTLIARNLAPYQVQGVYTPPAGNVTYEISPLSNSNVIDSPDTLISTNQAANQLYPLNEYGPEGGFLGKYSVPGNPYPVESNKGPYDPNDTVLDLVNEFYIDTAYIQNKYGPESGYKDMYEITDVVTSNKFYLPYWDPAIFVPSFYSPYEILTSSNPTGSNGTLSQDSYLAKIGAAQLKGYFEDRIAAELNQLTIGSINLDTLSDPFSASLLATGQQPFFIKNWKITVPENPILAAVSFANRLSGTYFPVSFIPGDYFNENNPEANVSGGLNTANNLTGGALGGILNKYRNPSELFLANTGNGQQSVLFGNLNYNLYRPIYQKNLIQGASQAINNLFNGDNGGGGYYVGNENAEPGLITNPSNEVAVDRFGKQQATLVYGPDELGKLYEGNEGKLNFGLAARSHHDGDGIDGRFVWTSPKYRPNAGFKVGKGGETFQQDSEFNIIEAQYSRDQSIDVEFKGGSILDNTQRIINAGDAVQGAKRLKHVGNAINQVSKVFNDGYKELTKGSQVIAYYDSSTGSNVIGESGFEVGREYCRVFQKDTPYYTYADLQKTDGITTSGRRFNNSVFDNTYNLNIAPLRNPGSTNIVDNKVKKYMFSLENLAWRTSSEPGFRYDDLPVCEKGPNGGRIMWFPPYDISFSEDSKANWSPTSFLGRPEPIFTYKDTSRSGTISWIIVVDHPSVMNTIVRQQLKSKSAQEVNSILDSFFAGCVKYDIYDLALKFNQIPTSDLYTYQQLLNEPKKTQEEVDNILNQIYTDGSLGGTNLQGSQGGGDLNDSQKNTTGDTNINSIETTVSTTELDGFKDYAFYFENDSPFYNPPSSMTNQSDPAEWGVPGPASNEYDQLGLNANWDYEQYYNFYLGLRNLKYKTKAPEKCYAKGQTDPFLKTEIDPFFDKVVVDNFNFIKNNLLVKISDLITQKNGKITIELEGSASPIQSPDYNVLLSDRRINSVLKWFEKQKVGEQSFKSFIDEGKLSFNTSSKGEGVSVTPKSADGKQFTIDCGVDIVDNVPNGPVVGTGGQWYSTPAMACRKVRIKGIIATITQKIEPTPNPDDTPKPVPIIDTGTTTGNTILIPPPIKPIETPDPIQKVKEGISKKILRHLFSECDYFDVLKETDPMVFESLKDRIKYFSPAFHSMTPEGLNARLTFLQQCMRPGQTIPVIGPDGNPKYNDALNTSFGAPPVLVLRVGDFFHTKIIPNSLGIQYEPLLFDINPEGIGVQPMLAKITLGFDFIGGHGLAEPVKQLQNALSFNFYANTEIYDERSVATEDTTERDEKLVGKIVKGGGTATPPVGAGTVQNQIPEKGGGTIGTILSTNYQSNNEVEVGDIDYTPLMKELSDGSKNYFTTIFNQLRTITKTSNYGIMLLASDDRKFNIGEFNQYETPVNDVPLYGRSLTIEKRIEKLIKKTLSDVKGEDDPISKPINEGSGQNTATNAQLRELKAKLEEEVGKMETELNAIIIEPVNTMTSNQESFNYTLRKTDVVCNKLDGIKKGTGDYKVYTLSGENIDRIVQEYTTTVAEKITDYTKLFLDVELFNEKYYENDSNFDPITDNVLKTEEDRRFYLTMSQIFTDENKFNAFVTNITSGPKISENPTLIAAIKAQAEEFKKLCKTEYDAEIKRFDDIAASSEYQDYEKFTIDEFDAKAQYTTDKIGNNLQKKNRLKDLYLDVNVNVQNKTYNGKVTFN